MASNTPHWAPLAVEKTKENESEKEDTRTSSIAICVLGPAFSQTTAKPKVNPYQKLLAAVTALDAQVRATCKTDECAALATAGDKLVNDTRTQMHNKTFDADTRKQFHQNVGDLMLQMRDALAHSLQPSTKTSNISFKFSDGRPHFMLAQDSPSQCEECGIVFEEATAICSLYLLASPTAAAICEAVAIYKDNQCVATYCPGDCGELGSGCDD